MFNWYLVLFWLGCMFGVTHGDYNCLRSGIECTDSNNKCEANGTCTCATGSAYDCGLRQDLVVLDCQTCQNGGSCYKDEGTGKNLCYCAVDYYGLNCEFKRVSVKCNGSGMVINVNPHGTFRGNIFVFEHRTNTLCHFLNVDTNKDVQDADSKWKGFAQYLRYNDTCGDAEITANETMAVYEFKIVTAYNTLLVTSLDEFITAKCFIQTGGSITISSDVVLSNYVQGDFKSGGSVEETFSPIEFKLLTNNTEQKTVKLGEVVSLQFELSTQSELNAIRLESCVAETNEGGILTLVANGCRTEDANQLVSDEASGNPERSVNDTMVTFKITAFKFMNSNQVNFRCIVLACKAGDSKCEKQCISPLPEPPISRRKRDANTVRKQVTGSLIITDGSRLDSNIDNEEQCLSREQLNKLSYHADSSSTNCFALTEVLAVIITLSVVLILVMVTVALLTMRYIRNRQAKVEDLKFNDARPTFTIPRASVTT